MRRRAIINERPRGGRPVGENVKYKAPSDPLQVETTLKDMEPTQAQEHSKMLEVVNLLIDDPKVVGEEKKALSVWKANLLASTIGSHVKKAFVRDFWAWLVGQGTQQDVDRTFWGRRPLTDDPEVERYISLFPAKMQEYRVKLYLLANRRPIGINECFLFYKYIVRGDFKVDSGFDAEFLKDWQTFGKAYDFGRAEGDEVQRPGGGAHETAPYGDSAKRAADDREKGNMKPSLDGFHKSGGAAPNESHDSADEMPDAEPSEEEDIPQDPKARQEKVRAVKGNPPHNDERMVELLQQVLTQRTTLAQGEKAASEESAKQSAKVATLEKQITELQQQIAFREQTRTGAPEQERAELQRIQQQLTTAEQRAGHAEKMVELMRQEQTRERQIRQEQFMTLTKELATAVSNIKFPAINVAPVVVPAPNVTVTAPPGERGPPGPQGPPGPPSAPVAMPIPVAQTPALDFSGISRDIQAATTAMNALGGKILTFMEDSRRSLDNLKTDITAEAGTPQQWQQDLTEVVKYIKEISSKTAPIAVVTGNSTAVEANIRANDMERLAGILSEELGRKGKELETGFLRALETHSTGWEERLKVINSPQTKIDFSSVTTAIQGSWQSMMTEMNAINGTSKALQDVVRHYHEQSMKDVMNIAQANAALEEKIKTLGKLSQPAKDLIPSRIVDKTAELDEIRKLQEVVAKAQEARRQIELREAATKDQLEKFALVFQERLTEAQKNGRLKDEQIARINSNFQKERAKYTGQINTLRNELEAAKKQSETRAASLQDGNQDLENRFYELLQQLRQKEAENEKLTTNLEEALARVPPTLPHVLPEPVLRPVEPLSVAVPATTAAPIDEPLPAAVPATATAPIEAPKMQRPRTKHTRPTEEASARVLEESRRGEEAITEEELEAVGGAEMKEGEYEEKMGDFLDPENFHPTALDTTVLVEAAASAKITEFSTEEATAPSLTEIEGEEVISKLDADAQVFGRLQMAIDSYPLKNLAEALSQAYRLAVQNKAGYAEQTLRKAKTEALMHAAAGKSEIMTGDVAKEVKDALGETAETVRKNTLARTDALERLEEKPGGKKKRERVLESAYEKEKKGKGEGKIVPTRQKLSAAEAIREVKTNFNRALHMAQKQKIKYGVEIATRVAEDARDIFLKGKIIPSVETMFKLIQERSAAVV